MVPLIEDFHKHSVSDGHVTDMDPSNLNIAPWNDTEKDMIKSVKIGVSRNFAGFSLGPGISKAERKQVEQNFLAAFMGFSGDLKGKYYSLKTMNEDEKEQLA